MHDPFAGPGRFYKGNLHTHSTASDGVPSPEAVCARYREGGYDFLALTDHFMKRFNFPLTDTRPFRTPHFTTILSAELHAPAIMQGEPWHIVAIGLPLDFAPPAPEELGPALAARAAAAGAFTVMAHPGWYGMTLADAETVPSAHAVEIYNHTSEVDVARGDGAWMLDALLARRRHILAVAVDDSHAHFRDWFGGWTMVKAGSLEPEALVAALKAGRYYSSQGPEILGIELDGEEIAVECSPAATISVLGRAPTGRTVFGEGLRSARLSLASLRPGGYARIVVTDAAGKHAWSNPLWFDDLEGAAP